MTDAGFSLHPRLAADAAQVVDWPLCRVLRMNDARYPWLILVPRRASIVEVYDLPAADQATLWQEVTRAGQALMQATGGHKLNVAALGNQVPQLHVHVVVRQPDDPAWPGPIWGVGQAEPVQDMAGELARLEKCLSPGSVSSSSAAASGSTAKI